MLSSLAACLIITGIPAYQLVIIYRKEFVSKMSTGMVTLKKFSPLRISMAIRFIILGIKFYTTYS